jgi:hypothetical protein
MTTLKKRRLKTITIGESSTEKTIFKISFKTSPSKKQFEKMCEFIQERVCIHINDSIDSNAFGPFYNSWFNGGFVLKPQFREDLDNLKYLCSEVNIPFEIKK